jgi:aldehyde:ferredoxin oxidoreductase
VAHEDLKLNYDLLFAMQDYGLDEFSMPQLLDFALKLYDAGILTDSDLPELPADAVDRISYLLEKIARREGIGDALANGVYMAARQIGNGAEAYDHTANKVEQVSLRQETDNFPYFLMYSTGHKMNIAQMEGSFPHTPIPDKKIREQFVKNWDAAPERFKKWFLEWEPAGQLSIEATVNIADWNEAMHYADDAVGICPLLSSFRGQYGGRPPYHINNLPLLISLATGIDLDSDALMEITDRNRQLVRAINVRRGLRRIDDKPPGVHLKLQLPEIEQKLLDSYYEFRGWSEDGIPGRETLNRLGLNYVCEDFVKRGIYEVPK